MHTLLGYRFDHLMLERIQSGEKKNQTCRMLSIRMVIDDIEKEKNFYIHLLGVAPLVENEWQVLLPLSPGVTLNLISAENKSISDQGSEFMENKIPLELDLQIENIQATWKTVSEQFDCPDKNLCSVGSKKMFHVISPAGITLRFWQ